MIKHVIIWSFREGLDEKEKAERSAEIKKGLEALKGVVPGLLDIKVYTGLLPSSNGDLMLDSSFESEDALKGYQTHPEHVKVAQIVKSVTASRSCADYTV